MDDIQLAKLDRKTWRSQVSKYITAIDSIFAKSSWEVSDFDELRLKLNNFNHARVKLEEAQEELQKVVVPEKAEKEADKMVEYRNKIDGAIFKIERFLLLHKVDIRVGSSSISSNNDSAGSQDTTSSQRSNFQRAGNAALYRLPQLELQPFEGDYLVWTSFWEQFDHAIGSCPEVTSAAKLRILISLLRGPPLDMVRNLHLIDSNFDVAIQMLKERYESPEVLKNLHYQALFQFQPLESASDLHEVRKLENSVSTHVSALLLLNAEKATLYDKVSRLFPYKFVRHFIEDTPPPRRNVSDLLKFVRTELNLRESWQPVVSPPKSVQFRPQIEPKVYVERYTTTSALVSTDRGNSSKPATEQKTDRTFCVFCDMNTHGSRMCMAPISLKVKLALLNAKCRCTQCFKVAHIARECTFPYRLCERCNGRHFVAVCPRHPYATYEPAVEATETTPVMQTNYSSDESDEFAGDEPEPISIHFVSSHRKKTVLMPTAEVFIGKENRWVQVVCLLDSGSQRSFLINDVFEELQLPIAGHEHLKIEGFAANNTQGKFPRVTLDIKGVDPTQIVTIEALVVSKLSNYCPQTMSPDIARVWKTLQSQGLKPADTRDGTVSRQLKLIIGADFLNLIQTGVTRRVGTNLVACETKFGWALQGVIAQHNSEPTVDVVACSFIHTEFQDEEKLDDLLKQFWELESLGVKEEEVIEDKVDFSQTFRDQLSFDGTRYSVGLPWFESRRNFLQSNRDVALLRYKRTVGRLLKNPYLFDQYNKAITAYIDNGHAEEVNENDPNVDNHPVFYLPHHPIIDNMRSTRVRIVFDASAHADQQLSLNDCLFQGSDIKIDLLRILLNFRTGKVACTSDIQKAFLQIEINNPDRDVLRYFWIDPTIAPSEYFSRPKIFRMTRVTFGITCSPYLLHQTIKEHCEILLKTDPEFGPMVELLLKLLYVDDIVLCADTEQELRIIVSSIEEILNKAGFKLHKTVYSTDRGSVTPSSVLGLGWDTNSDQLFIKPIDFPDFSKILLTKRQIVRHASRLFDPLGVLSPISIKAKFIIQELWKRGCRWDEIIPMDLVPKWDRWVQNVNNNQNRRFPRYLFESTDLSIFKDRQFTLHFFSDASPKAYGVVVYAVYKLPTGEIASNLLMAKFRVAPIHDIKIPRLELTAALMAAFLFNYLKENFFVPQQVFCWTDSKAALGWIHNATVKTGSYVFNRVKKIRAVFPVETWQHCAGEDNPADFATRPQLNLDESLFSRWWKGPQWESLMDFYRTVPRLSIAYIVSLMEFVTEICLKSAVVATPPKTSIDSLIDITRFSTFSRLMRVSSTVIKALDRFQKDTNPFEEAFQRAELFWIYAVQSQYFRAEQYLLEEGLNFKLPHNSKLIRLRPFLDVDNIMRLQGRLQRAALSYDERHPIILPSKHRWTQLLIDHTHRKLNHAGVSTTLTFLRQRFWILSGRRACKAIIQRCLTCSKFKCATVQQPTAPLPEERVDFIYPFSCVGIDFAGPAYVRGSSQFELQKSYIVLFSCAASRALHLEIVSSLSAGHFLLALRRFIARRGPPSVIYSDNALQFKRAAADLEEVSRVCATPEVQQFCEVQRIQWKWIAERAPWWGGFWERMVRSVKEPLRRTLGNTTLNYEELETVIVEIEAIINSRPLAVDYDDAHELNTITPAHLLLGRPLLRLHPDPIPSNVNVNPLSIYSQNKRIKEALANQWRNAYLLQLRNFHLADNLPLTPLNVGDVVLLLESDKPRYKWKLSRILQLIPGRDGVIRSCHLRTTQGQELRRPVNLIAPLEFVNTPALSLPLGTVA